MPAKPEPTKPKSSGSKSSGSRSSKSRPSRSKSSAIPGLPGWDRLRHGGLLFDARRSAELRRFRPAPLPAPVEDELRRLGTKALDAADPETLPPFVTFVLTKVCGFSVRSGSWLRGNAVPSAERRRAITGEMVTPRALWTGDHGARLPVFFDDGKRLGIGQSRRSVSRVVEWLRAGNEHLALLTNGRQWRLLFAGLDYDAWCQWDLDSWFHEGALSDEVETLRTLLSPPLWTPSEEGADPPLLKAIRDTRKGQAEISEVLGERVREAVEILIRGHGEALKSLGDSVAPADLYRAACRVVMRMVVILYAESRDLLPTGNALYAHSYGLGSLRESLERDNAAGRPLAESRAAWPRTLALFSLIHDGSAHPALPVFAYGGDLFAPGDPENDDGLSRALSTFETAGFERETLFDDGVHRMLEKLTRTTIRVRQGRASVRVAAPVDFSDLSSEYLGVLYEGLLDYELKTAPADDPVIFLTVGNQPALPLSRLDAMDDRALRALFETLKKNRAGADEEAGAEDSESSAPASEGPETDSDRGEDAGESPVEPQEPSEYRARADRWARRAVVAARLVRKLPDSASPERRLRHETQITAEARRLVARLVRPGEWYLVRWGGTRKGSGSFYTRPGLAIPTVQRTLRPLTHDPPLRNGSPNRDAPAAEWTPRKPEEILALTVCDPACGSGTFPLAALRFLTDALYASLWHHGRIEPDGETSLDRLLGLVDGDRADRDRSREELLPCRPDEDGFEPRLKAVLRRYVVERCLYAVDLDPLAVELCRLSLWIETMDKELPFGFLDHKIKCGNALVGAWFDTFRHYPVMAWKNRKGGDEGHTNGVHFRKGARTRAIKEFVEESLKPDLRQFLAGETLFQKDLLAKNSQAHDEAQSTLEMLHSFPVRDPAALAARYRSDFLQSPARRSLKDAMDLWCACWFWPADALETAPLPSTLAEPPPSTTGIARRVATEMRFFHWELEFPDVFRDAGSGFDAVLGNPPWEIAKPISMEFFADRDPLYRSYGKQEALKVQRVLFEDEDFERAWLDYQAGFRARSNFTAHSANPFGDPGTAGKSQQRFTIARGRRGLALHDRWRTAREDATGYCDAGHPFRHQGSADLNLYKQFLETAHALLRSAGRLGFLVPSGLYSDHGARDLRTLFLERCRWEWLFSFENRGQVFPIHRSYKFNPAVVQKGGKTDSVRAAFMRHDPDDWERAEEIAIPYAESQIERFSPASRSFVEIQSRRDLEILEKIYENAVLLGDDSPDGWNIRYATEFHMTNDSHLFRPRPRWEADGYRPDEYSRWLLGNWRPIEELWQERAADPGHPIPPTTIREAPRLRRDDMAETEWRLRCAPAPYDGLPVPRAAVPPGVVLSRQGDAWIHEAEVHGAALPLYQGIMIQPFVPCARGWVSGTGLRANWDYTEMGNMRWNPQYLVSMDDVEERDRRGGSRGITNLKIGFRDVSRDTDVRSFQGTLVPGLPSGHSAPVLGSSDDARGAVRAPLLLACLNSFLFDWQTRQRGGAAHLTWGLLAEMAVLGVDSNHGRVENLVARLNLGASPYAPFRLFGEASIGADALLESERSRLRPCLDAIVAARYGMDADDLGHVLREVDLPVETIRRHSRELDICGFWRVDRDKDPELRHTVLTLVAFHDLQAEIEAAGGDRERGIAAFLAQNDGEGWMLPETLRLADYGLGHDERAQHPQPVRSRLGPRFYDWQLAQSPEERWRETRLHARNLLGATGYGVLLAERIERRVAEGKPHLDLLRLANDYERRLAGDPGQVAMLAELYARKVPDPRGWWDWITALRADGHLPDDRYRDLLDELRKRKLLTETEHADLLRGGPPPLPIPEDEAIPRAAEPRHRLELRSQSDPKRGDLFE